MVVGLKRVDTIYERTENQNMTLYIYRLETNTLVARIHGNTSLACERKAERENFDPDVFGFTYSPAFGLAGGISAGKVGDPEVQNFDAEARNA